MRLAALACLGGGLGLLVGAGIGVAIALAVASLLPPRNDGTFGMRELIVGLPVGAAIGTVIGVVSALRITRP